MKRLVLVGALVLAAASPALAQRSQSSQTSGSSTAPLGTVHIAKTVMADGKPLPAGTYQVRLTADEAKPAVGQSPDAERYVEFLKNGKVVAREVATVISAADIGQVAKGAKPAPGTAKVEELKGGKYMRVWINKSGNNYLINLPVNT
jgi:hypothetical protein